MGSVHSDYPQVKINEAADGGLVCTAYDLSAEELKQIVGCDRRSIASWEDRPRPAGSPWKHPLTDSKGTAW